MAALSRRRRSLFQFLLLGDGAKLRAAGVDFRDVTRLFAKLAEPIYADPFCHYNQRGNELPAEAIAETIVAAVDKARQ
jgi:hypothetical protein